jgi:outer membrane protein insertion porin family
MLKTFARGAAPHLRSAARLAAFWFVGVALFVPPAHGQAPTVSSIEVTGKLNRVAESLIRSTVGLSEGVELSQENVQEAVRSLENLNVFEDIQIWAEEDEAGSVKLIVVVEEYPALEGIRFKGHTEIKDKEMKAAIGLAEGQVITPRDITRGRQTILDLYKEKGYLRATVTGKLFDAENEGEVFLQYDIDEGKKVKIARIDIHNNTAFDDGKINKQMETKENRWWRKGEFKAETFQGDKERILAFYRSKGYQQARIASDSVYYDESREKLFIELEVEEGERYRLGTVSWQGNELFDNEELFGHLRLKDGDVLKFSTPELAYLVKSAYYEKGYLDTEVIPVEMIRGDSVDVDFQVFEGEPFRIRRIEIAGNVKTREKVLRREIKLRPGAVFKQSELQESQRRLSMLGYFRDIQIRDDFSRIAGDKSVDLTFQVEEQQTGAASMGAGYSDRDKLVGTIGLQIPNLRGTGQKLDFNWEFGQRRERFLIGFTEPWLMDTPTSLSFRVSTYNQQYQNSFDFRRNSVNIRLGRRLNKPAYSSVSMGYELRDERYTDFAEAYVDQAEDPRFSPRTTSSFDLTFRRDTRDFPDFPTTGTVISYSPEMASSLIAGDVDFHRHELRYNFYRPSWWKFVLAVETKVAIIDGFSRWDDENISFWDRFAPGGVDWWDGQVRGYPDGSLGPRNPDTGFLLGGRSMMTINIEYRFPITERQVVGLAFADLGNAWTGVSQVSPFDLRRSIGTGFRVITPMLGMIGFDFAYGFDRREVDGVRPGLMTHFQFGPRFF